MAFPFPSFHYQDKMELNASIAMQNELSMLRVPYMVLLLLNYS